MKVSFDGEDANENNNIRKKGDFFRDAANVKDFCKIRRTMGYNTPKIIIANAQIGNKVTLDSLYESKYRGKKSSSPFFEFDIVPKYIKEYFSEESNEVEFRSYPAMVWPGYEEFGEFCATGYDTSNPKYCGSLFETFTILSNGDVVLCCNDIKGEFVVGNIHDMNVFDIRINFKVGKYSALCQKCAVVLPRYLYRS